MITQTELAILDWIQATFRCGFLDAVMPVLSALAEYGALWIILALVMMAFPRTRKAGIAVAAALILEVILCSGIVKPLVARPRPYTYRPDLALLVPTLWDYSFPSGHTAASFAAAFALCAVRQRGWPAAMVLAALIGLSRLYLYMHFPTDVLAGMLLGLLCGLGGAFLAGWSCRMLEKRKNRRHSCDTGSTEEKTYKS